MISGQQAFFFLATWWAGYFFLSKFSAGYFFILFISLQDFFSSKKCHVFTFTERIYIYIVVIIEIVQYGAAKP